VFVWSVACPVSYPRVWTRNTEKADTNKCLLCPFNPFPSGTGSLASLLSYRKTVKSSKPVNVCNREIKKYSRFPNKTPRISWTVLFTHQEWEETYETKRPINSKPEDQPIFLQWKLQYTQTNSLDFWDRCCKIYAFFSSSFRISPIIPLIYSTCTCKSQLQ